MSDIPAGDGNVASLFYGVPAIFTSSEHRRLYSLSHSLLIDYKKYMNLGSNHPWFEQNDTKKYVYLGSNRMSRLRLEFRKAASRALVVVVVVVVVDTPATTKAVVATVVVTASENVDSVLTVLLFTYKPVTSL